MTDESNSIRALVIDDEAPARQLLCEYLAQHADVTVVGECSNGFEAIKAVAELSPDLLFLDIQMPKLDGFEVLELLGDEAPSVIFVTAYDEHALRAFEVHALDYLLKPFTAERLSEALTRWQRTNDTSKPAADELSRVAHGEQRFLERVLVRDGSRIHVVPVERLDYAEAQDDYIILATGGAKLRKQQTLTNLADSLDPDHFVRIHRSYVLNIDCLSRIELYAKDSRVAILRDGSRLPVSRSGYGRLRELL